MSTSKILLGSILCLGICQYVSAVDPGQVQSVTWSNKTSGTGTAFIQVAPGVPNADEIRLLTGTSPDNITTVVGPFSTGYNVTNFTANSKLFYKTQITPLSSNAVAMATVLNRLAYGTTVDDVELIMGAGWLTNHANTNGGIGIDAWIAKQMPPTWDPETVESDPAVAELAGRFATDFSAVIKTNPYPGEGTAPNDTGPGTGGLNQLRALHLLRSIKAKHQTLEILYQFFDNHFTTQFSKSRDTVGNVIANYNGVQNVAERIACHFEYQEGLAWRQVLTNRTGTFGQLLTICCKSPAMSIYMDSYASRGDGTFLANENFAREFRELFSMGVDNGYDQMDIVQDSTNWTGWDVRYVEPAQWTNTFRNPASVALPGGTVSNSPVCWIPHYRAGYHGFGAKYVYYVWTNFPSTNGLPPGILAGTAGFKKVPARFGAPYTTKLYGTNTVPGAYALYIAPSTAGADGTTNGYGDALRMITHQADLPFVQEYLSVKLCQLLVHDDFHTGYDYSNTNTLSDEGKLVKACMAAWESGNPKGQIWDIVKTITDSDMFRTNGYAQKVKTPLEFAASAIRTLRMTTTNGYSADTDGYSLTTPLARMGSMNLFDRDTPDGWAEYGSAWVNAGTLAERTRFIQTFLMPSNATYTTIKNDGMSANKSIADPVGIVTSRMSLSAQQSADAVASFFVSLIYPGEGLVNLASYRDIASRFLNTDQYGNLATSQSFATVRGGGPTPSDPTEYDTRIRGMVSMLLTLQRFNEQ